MISEINEKIDEEILLPYESKKQFLDKLRYKRSDKDKVPVLFYYLMIYIFFKNY